MNRLDLRERIMATSFAAMAGMVDAIGFMASGGFFLSFMSGNSTRLSIGLAEGAPYIFLVAALIASFVCGVIWGSLIGNGKDVAPSKRQAIILAGISILLFLAPVLAESGWLLAAISLAAFCMGAENTLFERDGSVSFGLTYMTGALVKIGQGIATMLRGGSRTAWLPYLFLWAGLIGGAVVGATVFATFDILALWLPAGLAAAFAIIILRAGQATQP
ncbi:MAG: YoaK family protein [Sphingorhabdus sp.]